MAADWKQTRVTASQQVIASATGGQSWHWRSLAHVATHTSEDAVECELEVIREDDDRAVDAEVVATTLDADVVDASDDATAVDVNVDVDPDEGALDVSVGVGTLLLDPTSLEVAIAVAASADVEACAELPCELCAPPYQCFANVITTCAPSPAGGTTRRVSDVLVAV